MNPNANERGLLDLPTPMTPENTPGAVTPAPERAATPFETLRPPAPIGPVQTTGPLDLPVPTAPVPQAPVNLAGSQKSGQTPAVADDADLIEKEWVQKAKEIIAETQNDPHKQSKELNIFKADYMQKRYNKVLKLSE